jgi:hypothetical protein
MKVFYTTCTYLMFRKTKSILLPRPTVFSAVFLTAYRKDMTNIGDLKVVLFDISINEYSKIFLS